VLVLVLLLVIDPCLPFDYDHEHEHEQEGKRQINLASQGMLPTSSSRLAGKRRSVTAMSAAAVSRSVSSLRNDVRENAAN
jgi:hypothetical protein